MNRAREYQMDTPDERKMKICEPLLIDFSWRKHMFEPTTDLEPERRNDPDFNETISHLHQTQQDEKKKVVI